ncbi:helix-turn-helix domain-containing protein [Providencia stuartii]|uniref:helix-turn-helix domain-containing protein n=1 Tax=Providencia stuartii TaxID=588 RepID=UPI0012B55AC3|nr:helix-turn-helix transcriptional regulator [Providencia stuartii]MTC11855.1 helix-turn-helix domain-containing protein [Providencia stuartii]
MENERYKYSLSVGQRIKSLRLQNGWGGEALGKITGISQQQISRFERGVNRIDVESLAKFANAFNVDIVVLLSDYDKTIYDKNIFVANTLVI